MKVLQINSVCGYGSTGKITVELYHKLSEGGHECCIAYGRGNAPSGLNTIKFGNKFDFYLHVLLTRFFDAHGFGSKKVTQKLVEQIKLFSPDVIHLHNIHGYYINIEILFKFIKENHIPVILTLHDCWTFTGHCAHFEPINCNKWKKQCEKCKLKKEYPKSWFADQAKKNYLRKKNTFLGVEEMLFVTPSKWLADMLKQSFLQEYPVITIPNGIDTNIFKILDNEHLTEKKKALSEKYQIDFSKKIFLGVASVWTKDKGFEDFIKMADLNLENVQFVMVGVNKEQKEILPKEIVGVERTENQQELAGLYACADVFLNPTYADTFPTVNMEAISCGTPVVTYNTCGSPENVPQGCGAVVERGNYIQLVHKALELNKSQEILSMSKLFDKDIFSSKYYETYMKMVRK